MKRILLKDESERLGVSEEKLQSAIGSRIEVLCEGFDTVSGVHFGRSRADAPDVDGKIYFTAPKKLPAGVFVTVEVTEAMDYDLFGEVISTR